MYRAEATTIEGFVQQLTCYIASGYRWYVTGCVPQHKDVRKVDARLIEKYEIDLSKYQRARKKSRGEANVQYLRFQRFFVVIATAPIGGHPFTCAERGALRDIRKQPIRFAGYSISSRRDGSALRNGVEQWRVHVRIDRDAFLELRDFYVDAATRRPRAELERGLREVRFEPYAPVRRQLLSILRQTNSKRRIVGLRPLRMRCLRFRRNQVRPFEPPGPSEGGHVGSGLVLLIVALVLAWRYGFLTWALVGLLAIVAYRAR